MYLRFYGQVRVAVRSDYASAMAVWPLRSEISLRRMSRTVHPIPCWLAIRTEYLLKVSTRRCSDALARLDRYCVSVLIYDDDTIFDRSPVRIVSHCTRAIFEPNVSDKSTGKNTGLRAQEIGLTSRPSHSGSRREEPGQMYQALPRPRPGAAAYLAARKSGATSCPEKDIRLIRR
jgi:hypothetical protein